MKTCTTFLNLETSFSPIDDLLSSLPNLIDRLMILTHKWLTGIFFDVFAPDRRSLASQALCVCRWATSHGAHSQQRSSTGKRSEKGCNLICGRKVSTVLPQIQLKRNLIIWKIDRSSATWCATYPLRELSIHHEVVHVLLSPRQFQFPRHHSHEERSTAGALRERKEENELRWNSVRQQLILLLTALDAEHSLRIVEKNCFLELFMPQPSGSDAWKRLSSCIWFGNRAIENFLRQKAKSRSKSPKWKTHLKALQHFAFWCLDKCFSAVFDSSSVVLKEKVRKTFEVAFAHVSRIFLFHFQFTEWVLSSTNRSLSPNNSIIIIPFERQMLIQNQ